MDAFEIVTGERYDPGNDTPPTYPPLPSFAEALSVPVSLRFNRHKIYFYGYGLTPDYKITVRYTVRIWQGPREILELPCWQLTSGNQYPYPNHRATLWPQTTSPAQNCVQLFPAPRQQFDDRPFLYWLEPAQVIIPPFAFTGQIDRVTVSLDKIEQMIAYRIWVGVYSET